MYKISSSSTHGRDARATTLLAFGAHPDDIEFGCGGVMARETKAGRTAHSDTGVSPV